MCATYIKGNRNISNSYKVLVLRLCSFSSCQDKLLMLRFQNVLFIPCENMLVYEFSSIKLNGTCCAE